MLYLTYCPQTDGLGGQYQRIIGIIALAEFYGIEYLYTPIIDMEHTPNKSYLTDIENFFQIKQNYKNVNIITMNKTVQMENADDKMIKFYKNIYNNNRLDVLINITHPRMIVDNNLHMYNLVIPKLRQIKNKLILPFFKAGMKNIAIHIRRGDVTPAKEHIRYIPPEFYKNLIQHFIDIHPISNICIFTEITEENKEEFKPFEEMKNVKIIANEDILLTFEHLVRADILVIGKSSFSYVAGLYNENEIIHMNFWHPPMPHWNHIV